MLMRRRNVWKRAAGGPLARVQLDPSKPFWMNVWHHDYFIRQVGPTCWRTREDAIDAARDGIVGNVDQRPLYRLKVTLKGNRGG